MSFGYSVGDFIAGANLSYRLIRALSETRGACLEYQEAINELASMQHTFLQVGQMRPSSTLSRATINAASYIVLSSVNLIAEFLEKTKKYRQQFCGSASGNTVSDGWRKMGWVLFKSDELKVLRDSLHAKMTNIALLLSTAQFHGNIPSNIAVFEVDHFPKSSEELPSIKSNLPSSTAGLFKSSAHENIAPITDNKESNEDVQYSTTKTTQENLSPTQIKWQHSETITNRGNSNPSSSCGLEGYLEPELVQCNQSFGEKVDNNLASQPGPYQVNDFDDIVDGSKKGTPKTSSVAPAQSEPEPITSDRLEVLTRLEQFLKSDEVNSKEADLFKRLENELQKRETHAGRGPAQFKSMPIKFKDAVGRKFTFPFHLCQTWAGMERLICQAFMHVEVLGPHVSEGHYDLIGPNGEIILPQVWETMIEPDWAITMHMWPLPEKPKGLPEGIPVIDARPRRQERRGPLPPPPPEWIGPPPALKDDIIVIEDYDSIKAPKKKTKQAGGALKGLFGGDKARTKSTKETRKKQGVLGGLFNRGTWKRNNDSDANSDSSSGSCRSSIFHD